MLWGYNFSGGGMVFWIALLVVLVWALINWLTRKSSPTILPSPASTPSR